MRFYCMETAGDNYGSVVVERHDQEHGAWCRREDVRDLAEAILRAVDEEPELPGSITKIVFLHALADPEETLRVAVRVTKAGVRSRVEQELARREVQP